MKVRMKFRWRFGRRFWWRFGWSCSSELASVYGSVSIATSAALRACAYSQCIFLLEFNQLKLTFFTMYIIDNISKSKFAPVVTISPEEFICCSVIQSPPVNVLQYEQNHITWLSGLTSDLQSAQSAGPAPGRRLVRVRFCLFFLSRQFSGHAHRQLTFQDPELACLPDNIS